MQRQPSSLPWALPADTPHEGIPLGNGLFGTLIWGEEALLRLSINRADYWDHRGGITFGPEATYTNLRRWLAEGNEAEIRRVFEGAGAEKEEEPRRPTRLPMGRVEIVLPRGRICGGSLDLATGEAQVNTVGPIPLAIHAVVPRGRPLLAARIEGASAAEIRAISRPPDADEVRFYWQSYAIAEPELDDTALEGGWYQELPADPGLYVAWRLVSAEGSATELYIAAVYGNSREEAFREAQQELEWAATQGYSGLARAEAVWWRDYWEQTAQVYLPDPTLQEAYELGMYKLAGIAAIDAPPATLQGPWVEDHRMPPWSSDYHFNINVQECYWPAYAGNHLELLAPLFDLIASWEPRLRETARQFLGIDDGLMLHHAVDDRGTCMGGFWTGAIDHGSTGWVAHMMWEYYLYSGDRDFLRDRAYPFIKAAMRVYEGMLEETSQGTLRLPVSVSPEYGGASMNAWGSNASFQLAIIHALCRALIRSVQILNLPEDVSRWQRIDRDLPLGSIGGEGENRELYLWDGQPLAHSHRHHSYLAGLYPFDVLDYYGSAEDRILLDNSARTWTARGVGEWSGWCMPWAAILWSRMGNGERAALLLEEHRRVFTNRGRATTHDAVFPGFTLLDRRPDIMQMDAAMGAARAVLEMLLHTTSGVTHVFPAIPAAWKEARFERIRTEGAFLVSAERRSGHTAWVRLYSEKGETLRLANPFATAFRALSSRHPGDIRTFEGDVVTLETAPGEEFLLYPAQP